MMTRLESVMQRYASGVGAPAACIFAMALAGCTVSSPLAITSTGADGGAALSGGSTIALSAADDPASLDGRFGAALSQTLSRNAIRIADNAPLLADYSIALAVASAGIVRGEGNPAPGDAARADNQDAPEPDWAAQPRQDRRFDQCEAQRLRATLVIFDRASGKVVYRGTGEAFECEFDDTALAQFAGGLVADAMAGAR